jgi:hypothetical protein
MYFDPSLENDEWKHFDSTWPMTWIVYVCGCGGDYLGALLRMHYERSGLKFLGLDSRGMAVVRTLDQKIINTTYLNRPRFELDADFYKQVNLFMSYDRYRGNRYQNVLFTNHAWHDQHIEYLTTHCPGATVIRLMPATSYEFSVAEWLNIYKNDGIVSTVGPQRYKIQKPKFFHDRVIDVEFGELMNPDRFAAAYSRMRQLMNLPCELISWQAWQWWIDQQHPEIQPHLVSMGNGTAPQQC